MSALKSGTALLGMAIAAAIRTGVRWTGKRIAKKDATWLESPMGPRGFIGSEFHAQFAEQQNLRILAPDNHGLLPDFDALRGSTFNPDAVCPEVRDFYEHTALYTQETWTEAPLLTRFFLWGLSTFVSRSMDQLNFPISPLDMAGGMSNEILPMENANGEHVATGWLRRLESDGRVIYASFYSSVAPHQASNRALKSASHCLWAVQSSSCVPKHNLTVHSNSLRPARVLAIPFLSNGGNRARITGVFDTSARCANIFIFMWTNKACCERNIASIFLG